MAKVFETWTVLKHGPLQKLADNLWTVEGTMPTNTAPRVMTIARLKDGRLLIHNAIALEESMMTEIEAFGTPACLVVPNGYHRQDAKIYKDRYPKMDVVTPTAATKRVEQVVPVTGDYAAAPSDDSVRLVYLQGCKGTEGILEVKSADGTTLVFNDAISNIPERKGVIGFLMAPTGKPSVPRISRWMIVKDKPAFTQHVSSLATPELRRVVVSHGEMITERVGETLKSVTADL